MKNQYLVELMDFVRHIMRCLIKQLNKAGAYDHKFNMWVETRSLTETETDV